jgi:hypothetical protein
MNNNKTIKKVIKMKKITLILALIVAVSMGAVAQPKKLSNEDKDRLFNGKVQMLQKKLGMTEDQVKDFIPVYKDYIKAIFEIKRPQRLKVKPEDMTKEQSYDEVVGQLKFKKDILDVQEIYTGKLKDVLTSQQLLMFWKAETAVQNSIRDHMKGRKAKWGKHKERKAKHKATYRAKKDSLKRKIAAQDRTELGLEQ